MEFASNGFELSTDGLVVVQFSVYYGMNALRFIVHGLVATLEIDDGKPNMAKTW